MTYKKATIYDLAEKAGTSASTVSAILSGSWRSRRIAEKTAHRVLALAQQLKYTVNLQASGLRRSRSGLIGMIIPMHDNRFFSAMSQTFEQRARERHLYPIVVSTLRDPLLEAETVRTLISYQIESLLVTGATDPDAVSRLCADHGIAHVNVDLPGTRAPSVISDNRWGAEQLTLRLIERSAAQPTPARDDLHFLGGVRDHATLQRVAGFRAAIAQRFGADRGAPVDTCGYGADHAEAAIKALHRRLGGLPRALFVNSTIALEGVVRFLRSLPSEEVRRCAIGSFDWDPFAQFLDFPLVMVKQDIARLIGEAFAIIDSGEYPEGLVIEVKPELIGA